MSPAMLPALRNDPAEARRVIENLLPTDTIRNAVLPYLAKLIEHAHKASPGRWGITLRRNHMLLNVGMIEVMQILDGSLHLILDNATADPRLRRAAPGVTLRRNPYKNAPDSLSYDAPLSKAVRVLPLAWPAHRRLVRRVIHTAWTPLRARAHSPGLIEYLSTFVGQTMPQPEYWQGSRDFLVYWLRREIEAVLSDGSLHHATSEQFGAVQPGDVLWIAGSGKDRRSLVTVGPLKVAKVASQVEAKRMHPGQPWPGRFHAFTAPGDETFSREVSLGTIAAQLRFVAAGSPKLNMRKPFGPQLQRIRKLTPDTARAIRELWTRVETKAAQDFEHIQSDLRSWKKLDQERRILGRREQSFLRDYLFRGQPTRVCALCGENLPTQLLVAAHIKPRAKCSDPERRDFRGNVVPMCLLGCDALFERRFLVVDQGRVTVRLPANATERVRRITAKLDGRHTSAWISARVKYFQWHAKQQPVTTDPQV